MKKVCMVLLIVILAGAIGFSSCASQAPAPAPAPAPTSAPAPKPTAAPSPTSAPAPKPTASTASPTAAPKPTAAPAQVWKMSLACQSPRGEVSVYENLNRFVDVLDKASGGRIKVTIYGPGELMPESALLQAVYSGAVEMAWNSATYYRGEIPVADVEFALPFDFDNNMQVQDFFFNKGFMAMLTKIYEAKGLHYFGPSWTGALDIISTKPINSIEDWKKVKTRTVAAAQDALNLLGIPTVFMPAAELPMALKLGTINACSFGSLDIEETLGLFDYCKYWVRPSIYECDRTSIMMGLKLWNTLPPDIQQIFQLAYADHQLVRSLRRWADRTEAMKRQLAKGLVVCQLPDKDVEALKTAGSQVWDNLAKKDATTAQAIKMLKEYLGRK